MLAAADPELLTGRGPQNGATALHFLAIEGHTDSDGEEAFNQDLSERRAAAVRAYLTGERGIQASRLESAGFGESKPVAENATPEGKQQNRRVELVRLGTGGN